MDLYFMEQLVTKSAGLEIHTLYYRTEWRASSNLYVRKIITFQEGEPRTESWEGLFSRYGRRNSRALHPYNVKGWRPFPTLKALEQALYSHEFHPNRRARKATPSVGERAELSRKLSVGEEPKVPRRKPKSKRSQEETTKSSKKKKSRVPKLLNLGADHSANEEP